MRFTHCLAIAAITLGLALPAQAGTIVFNDSGSIGEFSFTNTGIDASGTATIVAAIPSITAEMNTVNGAFIVPDIPAAVNGPVTLLVTPTGAETYNVVLTPGDYIKTIGGIPGQQAMMTFNLTAGASPSTLPNFFNTSGPVTSVIENDNPLYDFSNFASGKGTTNFTFTATAFVDAASFKDLFATVGAVAIGNGSFSQAAPNAIPEPASAALLGIGICSLLALRHLRHRLFKQMVK